MLDSLVSMLSYDALDHLNSGKRVDRQGTAHAHMVPWQAFEVADGYVVVAARDEKFWRNLCDAIDRPDLKNDPRSADNARRVANRDWLVPVLEYAFLARSKTEWVERLDEFDIPSAPVNDMAAVLTDDQVVARTLVRTYEHPTLGPTKYTPSPVKFSGWEMPAQAAPMLGEHTLEVLERLGYSADEIERLVVGKAVGVWSDQS
jgi:CoA:oxalate CoA-transferase